MLTRNSILRIALCGAVLLGLVNLAWSEDRQDEVKRVKASADVLNEIMAAPDKGVPQDLMESALCLGVVPSLKKGGFVFGAEYGKGFATCRTATGWSAPAPFKVVGGSWGLQMRGRVAAPSGSESFLAVVRKFSANAQAAKLSDQKTDGRQ